MIVEELSLRNWRLYRDPHVFRFEEGINLLLGRNEGGKSTLFEALTRALFDHYNSKTEEVKLMQPLGSTLGPEVTVIFRAGGKRFKLFKRFLQQPTSEFYTDRAGKWDLDHEKDAADEAIRGILDTEETSRTAARPEHRGLAQALWYLQKDRAIPEESWNDGVKKGLQGIVQLVVHSPEEDKILSAINDTTGEYYTQGGRVSTNSELARLQAEIPGDEQKLNEMQSETKQTEELRRDLEEADTLSVQKRDEFEKAGKALTVATRAVEDASELERKREERDRARQEAVEEAARLGGLLKNIEKRCLSISDTKKEISRIDDALAEANTDVRQESVLAERHARKWKEELEPRLKDTERKLDAFRALERLTQLETEQNRLSNHLEKLEGMKKRLVEKRSAQEKLSAPSKKEWSRFQADSSQIAVVNAQVEASAVRVGFEFKSKTTEIVARPKPQKTPDNEFIVSQPTEFEIRGLGKIRVRSGAASLSELLEKRNEIDNRISSTLSQYGAKDTEALASLHQKRQDMERDVKQQEKELREKSGEEPDAEAEKNRLEKQIQEERGKAALADPHAKGKGSKRSHEQTSELESAKKSLIAEIESEQAEEKKARAMHLKLVEKRQTMGSQLAGLKAQARNWEEENTNALNEYGTTEQLTRLVTAAETRAKIAQQALDEIMKDYEQKVEMPKRIHKQAERRVQELSTQLDELRTRIVDRLARIEEAAARGLYTQVADLEITLDAKKKRLASVERRAKGAKVLLTLVNAYQREQSMALAGPIQQIVNRWLQVLTEDGYDAMQLDEDLMPAGVRVPRYGADLPLESLSYGAQEQVIVLLRLAMGILLSKDERKLIVIDDRLVNADALRMKRLCLILQEVAEKCQILIATCNDTPYAGLGANIIRVPGDGQLRELSQSPGQTNHGR